MFRPDPFRPHPTRPVPGAQRGHFDNRTAGAETAAAHSSLAQSAQVLARLALEQPRGRLTPDHIVTVARNAQGDYPMEVQAAAAQFHAHRRTVRAAYDALPHTGVGARLFGSIRGYRHDELQAMAGLFAGQAAPLQGAFPGPGVPPGPGWRVPPQAGLGSGMPTGGAGLHGQTAGPAPQRDMVDEALWQLGRVMQRSGRAFLSVERLLRMERDGSSPARHALDNLGRWGRAVGSAVENRARLLLSEVEARYGDLRVLEQQAEQSARQAQQGVFGYPAATPGQAAGPYHHASPPVITEVDDHEPSAPAGAFAFHATPRAEPASTSGPVITEIVDSLPSGPASPGTQTQGRGHAHTAPPEHEPR